MLARTMSRNRARSPKTKKQDDTLSRLRRKWRRGYAVNVYGPKIVCGGQDWSVRRRKDLKHWSETHVSKVKVTLFRGRLPQDCKVISEKTLDGLMVCNPDGSVVFGKANRSALYIGKDFKKRDVVAFIPENRWGEYIITDEDGMAMYNDDQIIHLGDLF